MSDNTIVAFVLDRSGSMSAVKRPTLEAFNAYLDGLKADPDGIAFSLVMFDTQGIDTVYKNTPVIQVENLNDRSYQPRAGTPLIDAAYKTITAVAKKVAEYANPPKVIICIQTDGEENSSTEHTMADLNALIKEKTAAGWQFNFLGAGIDAYAQAAKYGIATASTMSYDHTSAGATRSAFAASAKNAQNFRRGLSADTTYSTAQRAAAGDHFVTRTSTPPTHTQPMHARVSQGDKAAARPIVDDIEL